ncbi:unnamed protein product, partial [Nesidiocoris tenuis]
LCSKSTNRRGKGESGDTSGPKGMKRDEVDAVVELLAGDECQKKTKKKTRHRIDTAPDAAVQLCRHYPHPPPSWPFSYSSQFPPISLHRFSFYHVFLTSSLSSPAPTPVEPLDLFVPTSRSVTDKSRKGHLKFNDRRESEDLLEGEQLIAKLQLSILIGDKAAGSLWAGLTQPTNESIVGVSLRTVAAQLPLYTQQISFPYPLAIRISRTVQLTPIFSFSVTLTLQRQLSSVRSSQYVEGMQERGGPGTDRRLIPGTSQVCSHGNLADLLDLVTLSVTFRLYIDVALETSPYSELFNPSTPSTT